MVIHAEILDRGKAVGRNGPLYIARSIVIANGQFVESMRCMLNRKYREQDLMFVLYDRYKEFKEEEVEELLKEFPVKKAIWVWAINLRKHKDRLIQGIPSEFVHSSFLSRMVDHVKVGWFDKLNWFEFLILLEILSDLESGARRIPEADKAVFVNLFERMPFNKFDKDISVFNQGFKTLTNRDRFVTIEPETFEKLKNRTFEELIHYGLKNQSLPINVTDIAQIGLLPLVSDDGLIDSIFFIFDYFEIQMKESTLIDQNEESCSKNQRESPEDKIIRATFAYLDSIMRSSDDRTLFKIMIESAPHRQLRERSVTNNEKTLHLLSEFVKLLLKKFEHESFWSYRQVLFESLQHKWQREDIQYTIAFQCVILELQKVARCENANFPIKLDEINTLVVLKTALAPFMKYNMNACIIRTVLFNLSDRDLETYVQMILSIKSPKVVTAILSTIHDSNVNVRNLNVPLIENLIEASAMGDQAESLLVNVMQTNFSIALKEKFYKEFTNNKNYGLIERMYETFYKNNSPFNASEIEFWIVTFFVDFKQRIKEKRESLLQELLKSEIGNLVQKSEFQKLWVLVLNPLVNFATEITKNNPTLLFPKIDNKFIDLLPSDSEHFKTRLLKDGLMYLNSEVALISHFSGMMDSYISRWSVYNYAQIFIQSTNELNIELFLQLNQRMKEKYNGRYTVNYEAALKELATEDLTDIKLKRYLHLIHKSCINNAFSVKVVKELLIAILDKSDPKNPLFELFSDMFCEFLEGDNFKDSPEEVNAICEKFHSVFDKWEVKKLSVELAERLIEGLSKMVDNLEKKTKIVSERQIFTNVVAALIEKFKISSTDLCLLVWKDYALFSAKLGRVYDNMISKLKIEEEVKSKVTKMLNNFTSQNIDSTASQIRKLSLNSYYLRRYVCIIMTKRFLEVEYIRNDNPGLQTNFRLLIGKLLEDDLMSIEFSSILIDLIGIFRRVIWFQNPISNLDKDMGLMSSLGKLIGIVFYNRNSELLVDDFDFKNIAKSLESNSSVLSFVRLMEGILFAILPSDQEQDSKTPTNLHKNSKSLVSLFMQLKNLSAFKTDNCSAIMDSVIVSLKLESRFVDSDSEDSQIEYFNDNDDESSEKDLDLNETLFENSNDIIDQIVKLHSAELVESHFSSQKVAKEQESYEEEKELFLEVLAKYLKKSISDEIKSIVHNSQNEQKPENSNPSTPVFEDLLKTELKYFKNCQLLNFIENSSLYKNTFQHKEAVERNLKSLIIQLSNKEISFYFEEKNALQKKLFEKWMAVGLPYNTLIRQQLVNMFCLHSKLIELYFFRNLTARFKKVNMKALRKDVEILHAVKGLEEYELSLFLYHSLIAARKISGKEPLKQNSRDYDRLISREIPEGFIRSLNTPELIGTNLFIHLIDFFYSILDLNFVPQHEIFCQIWYNLSKLPEHVKGFVRENDKAQRKLQSFIEDGKLSLQKRSNFLLSLISAQLALPKHPMYDRLVFKIWNFILRKANGYYPLQKMLVKQLIEIGVLNVEMLTETLIRELENENVSNFQSYTLRVIYFTVKEFEWFFGSVVDERLGKIFCSLAEEHLNESFQKIGCPLKENQQLKCPFCRKDSLDGEEIWTFDPDHKSNRLQILNHMLSLLEEPSEKKIGNNQFRLFFIYDVFQKQLWKMEQLRRDILEAQKSGQEDHYNWLVKTINSSGSEPLSSADYFWDTLIKNQSVNVKYLVWKLVSECRSMFYCVSAHNMFDLMRKFVYSIVGINHLHEQLFNLTLESLSMLICEAKSRHLMGDEYFVKMFFSCLDYAVSKISSWADFVRCYKSVLKMLYNLPPAVFPSCFYAFFEIINKDSYSFKKFIEFANCKFVLGNSTVKNDLVGDSIDEEVCTDLLLNLFESTPNLLRLRAESYLQTYEHDNSAKKEAESEILKFEQQYEQFYHYITKYGGNILLEVNPDSQQGSLSETSGECESTNEYEDENIFLNTSSALFPVEVNAESEEQFVNFPDPTIRVDDYGDYEDWEES